MVDRNKRLVFRRFCGSAYRSDLWQSSLVYSNCEGVEELQGLLVTFHQIVEQLRVLPSIVDCVFHKRLNKRKHIQAGRATHVENPLELPRMSEIAKGTVFGTGIHGHTVEIKRGVQWLTCKIITHNADSAPTMSPNFHLAKFEHTDCWLDLRNLLQEDALRVTGASHVLGRLKECLGAFHSPSVSCEADARPG